MIKNYPTFKKLTLLIFLLFSLTAFSQTQTETFTTSGTFTVPCGVTSIIVEAWGGGGGGQGAKGDPSAGGGGSGGGYVKTTIVVTAGNNYNYSVGTGGAGSSGANGTESWFINNTTLKAIGGRGAGSAISAGNSWGLGATAPNTGNVGGTIQSTYGGSGGNAGNNFSGGGGSSGGSSASGNASGMTGGTAPTDGYAGVNGRNSNGDGANGEIGAGGAGGRTSWGWLPISFFWEKDGGDGGDGQIRITYISSFQTYCSPTFTSGVEPITNVTFAGINNTTPNTLSGSSLESFCDIGTVVQGSATNPISIKGNTDGNYTDHVRAYIDWNQDGDFFDVGESYNIGTISKSTGIDTITLIGNIAVPATATLGNTRMRIIKRWNADPTDPCQTGSGYGQAEDYTINVIASRSITTGTITPTSYCVGASVNIPYTITGTFNNGNIFTAQLSDASGSFASPVTIGTRTATNAGTISGTIPLGTTSGSGYRIRVISNKPTVTGSVNTSNLTINATPSAPTLGTITQPTCATATGSVVLSGLPAGNWTINPGGITGSTPTKIISGLVAGSTNNYTVTNASGCTSSASVNVVISPQPTTPIIAPNKVNETCPTSNNGSITPVISGGLSNVRYLKLTQKYVNADAWQQVAEIEAFEIFTGTNVALTSNGASATASSTYLEPATTYGPQKAIDGNLTNIWHSNSTNIDEWIKVDLASAKNIDYLRIYNRSDCCWFRGQNMLLELFDASNNLVYSKTVNLWGNVNGSHYIDVNVLDVSWADGATTLNRTALDSGTYTLNYLDALGCSVSTPINISSTNTALSAPTLGTITQPTCAIPTGSVVLNGLPAGSWQLTRNPENVTTTGTGTSTTISGLDSGTYTYTVISTNNDRGLKGEYFNNMTLSGTPALTRTDATVNFDWGTGNPGAPIGNDNFSVRWTGQILPLYSEAYTFTTRSDDGIRLWVNGTQIINNWTDHGSTENTGSITLTAGVKYDIVLEFYENTGGAVAELSWSSASQTKQIIPQSQLYPSAVCSSTASANVVINALPSINTWNGSTDKNWNNANNWCSGVPSVTNNLDVVIPSAALTPHSPTLSTGDFGYVENILFENGSILTVEGNYLFVKKNLTLNGKIDLNEESQLVQDEGSVFDAASTGSIEIDQQGTSDNFKYNYWGSPVNTTGTTYTIAGVLRDGTDPTKINENNIIEFGAPYAFADGSVTSPIRLSTYWLYKYANLGTGYSGWTSIGKDGSLKIGEGFTMKGSNTNLPEQNYTFVGKPNNGDITLPIAAERSYLIGNPYPSAIDAKEFIRDNISSPSGNRTTNIIDGNLYFWDHFGGGTHLLKSYEGGYGILNLTGVAKAMATDAIINNTGNASSKIPPRFIPVAQGFFVTAVSSIVGTENILFKNSQRIYKKENPAVSQFMKGAKSATSNKETVNEDNFPKIYLKYSSPKGFHRQLLVGFIENTTDGVDIGYDAINNETFVEDMSWRNNNINFIIQAVSTLNDDRILPLEVKVATTGTIKISIDNTENIPVDTEIFMKDSTTGKTHNISQIPFEIELEAGTYTNRFAVTFKTIKLVAEDVAAEVLIPAESQAIKQGIQVFMNNSIKELQIKNNSTDEILGIGLYNYLGQRVNYWNTNLNRRTISLPVNTATGIYVVQINTKNGTVAQKVVVE